MGKKQNQSFLVSYIKLDKACSDMFGMKTGGVSEYINKLGSERDIPEREETMSRLVRYRGIRNKLAHEVGALEKLSEVKNYDIAWVEKFEKAVLRRRDPISQYQKSLRKNTTAYKVRRGFITAGIILLVLAIAAAVIYFGFIK